MRKGIQNGDERRKTISRFNNQKREQKSKIFLKGRNKVETQTST